MISQMIERNMPVGVNAIIKGHYFSVLDCFALLCTGSQIPRPVAKGLFSIQLHNPPLACL